MIYVLSTEAEKDFEIFGCTFENWSIEQAYRYLHLLIDEIEYLCLEPETGFDFGNIRKGYFRSKVKSHVIFYRINQKRNELQIIRVLHEMLDVESHI